MEEKTIIREKVTKKEIIRSLRILGIFIAIEVFLFFVEDFFRSRGLRYSLTDPHSIWSSVFLVIANVLELLMVLVLVALVVLIIYCLLALVLSKCEINVTSHRVYGHSWKQQVDLPLDSITAVKKGKLKSVIVDTASDSATFFFLEHQNEIFEAISTLLKERQHKPVVAPIEKMASSPIEELKEYKSLLESGIITQSEFDAKKKQLLEQ